MYSDANRVLLLLNFHICELVCALFSLETRAYPAGEGFLRSLGFQHVDKQRQYMSEIVNEAYLCQISPALVWTFAGYTHSRAKSSLTTVAARGPNPRPRVSNPTKPRAPGSMQGSSHGLSQGLQREPKAGASRTFLGDLAAAV
eukprot:scaffold173176_cov16-Prasinocladus_malaysianus.AAC.1